MSAPNEAPSGWKTLYNWLDWWSRLPPPEFLTPDEHTAVFEHLRIMRKESRDLLVRAWERQNDELGRDLESVRTRGMALLTATGVVSGVLALLVPVVAALHIGLNPASFLDDVLLGLAGGAFALTIYCAVATAVLGIRSQEVGSWAQNEMHPGTHDTVVGYELEYAYRVYVTYSDNARRFSNPPGYLRQAQTYFRLLVEALGGLVVLAGISLVVGALTQSVPIVSSHAVVSPAVNASAARTAP
jgi:hypothetical protein